LTESLELALLNALVLDFGLLVFFVFYAFNWAFDQIFGLRRPVSSQGRRDLGSSHADLPR
jgi:uncharacterized membrane protein